MGPGNVVELQNLIELRSPDVSASNSGKKVGWCSLKYCNEPYSDYRVRAITRLCVRPAPRPTTHWAIRPVWAEVIYSTAVCVHLLRVPPQVAILFYFIACYWKNTIILLDKQHQSSSLTRLPAKSTASDSVSKNSADEYYLVCFIHSKITRYPTR